MGRPAKQIKGQKFGKLTVIEPVYNKEYIMWKCQCECLKTIIVTYSDLKRNHTKSCGCLHYKKANESNYNTLYRLYQEGAKKRNLSFELLLEDIIKLSQQNCYYCNSPPISEKKKKGGKYITKYNGIDRINNNIGYTIKNCVTCCKICNFAKGKLSIENFTRWIEKVYDYQKSQSKILESNGY